MSRHTQLALLILALASMACGVFASSSSAAQLPTQAVPTVPPIPTRIPSTPTPSPVLSPTPTQLTQAQPSPTPQPRLMQAALIYASPRRGHLGLYLLSADGQFMAPLNLGPAIRHAVWPDVSPDGTWLAFVSINSQRMPLGIFITEMACAVLPEGCLQPPRQITFGEGMHPKWSPDGSRIAYTCNAGTDICLINADGSGRVNLTTDQPATDLYPDWTPDGRIVFMSDRGLGRNGRYSEIYIMNADGSQATRLTNDRTAYNAFPSVSPNGTFIAFESSTASEPRSDIFLIGIDGGNRTRVTADPAWNQNPVWSADGARLLFAGDYGDGNINLHLVNVDGTNRISLTQDLGEDGGFRWGHAWLPTDLSVADFQRESLPEPLPPLPTGSRPVTNAVIFATNSFNCPNCLESGIYIIGFDGANLTRLPVDGLYPAWSPDFTRFAFVRSGELYIANIDGSDVTQITHAYYELNALSWADEDLILAGCAPYGQHDVCLIDLATGAINNLTDEITFGSGIPYPSWFGQQVVVGSSVIDQSGQAVSSLPAVGRVSPDGTRLAFVQDRQIVVGDLGGLNTVALTNDGAAKGFPVWSFDGSLIVYMVAPGGGRLYLFAVRSDGAAPPYQLVPFPISLGPTEIPDSVDVFYGYGWGP